MNSEQPPCTLSLAIEPLNDQDSGDRIVLSGELDIGTAGSLQEAISKIELDPQRSLVLDFRQLTFIDSTGLRTVLAIAERAADCNCSLSIIKGPATVQRVFTLTGTEGELNFLESSEHPPSAG